MNSEQLDLFAEEKPVTVYLNGMGEPLPWEEDLYRKQQKFDKLNVKD